MVNDTALIGQKPQWLWPASSVFVQLARRNNLPVRTDEVAFNSPPVLYSWSPIVDALIEAGFVEKQDNTYYVVEMAELMLAIANVSLGARSAFRICSDA